jgi:hypothetical protein
MRIGFNDRRDHCRLIQRNQMPKGGVNVRGKSRLPLINTPRQTGNHKIFRQSASCEWRKPCALPPKRTKSN